MVASFFTQAQATALQRTVDLMIQGNAPELPFDATLMETVAKVAAATGYPGTEGAALKQLQERPISTLISFILAAGGATDGIVPEGMTPT